MIPQRRPLTNRFLHLSPSKPSRTTPGSKRARSPDHGLSQVQHAQKRARPINSTTTTLNPTPRAAKSSNTREKEVRQQQALEFKQKYRQAFCNWKFYFDIAAPLSENMSKLKNDVGKLDGKIQPFFDGSITHLISDRSPSQQTCSDKENDKAPELAHPLCKTPMKVSQMSNDCLQQAVDRGMKIWKAAKLRSVLDRCLTPSPAKASTSRPSNLAIASTKPSLSKLLADEKIHGTSERDPAERRINYHYFAPGSHFVLIEDMNQQLATLAAHEYPTHKNKDRNVKKPWPTLYCHPHARNPFIPFDEKEKRRWEKLQRMERDEEEQRAQRKKQRQIEALKRRAESKRKGDLRRTMSMNNLKRLANPVDGCLDPDVDADEYESANASGYLPSGNYLAASGNCVELTSAIATTSATSRFARTSSMSMAVVEKMKKQVTTSLRTTLKDKIDTPPTGNMGPPAVPGRLPLRKSKSTNTIKLPKRDEGTKPGYCESCRVRFDDFNQHLASKKHVGFSRNPANFEALDFVLGQLQRQTIEQIETSGQERLARFRARCRATILSKRIPLS